MSEYLISWLNNEIHLSKKITNIPKDFNNGYLFAELLYKTKQLPSLKIFKNSSIVGDILQNFSILEHFFNEMDISFNDNNKRKILNKDKYTSFFYLHKIKQVLDRKCINLKQIHLKNSNTLSKLFNDMMYKNDSDKYLLHVDMFAKKSKMKNKNFSYNKSTTFYTDYKNNVLAKEIKSDYSNLDLNDKDVKMIVDNIEDNTNKYRLLRTNIYNLEQNKRKLNLETETNNLKNWTKSLRNVNNFKIKQKEEEFKPVNYYRSSVNKEFRLHDKKFQFLSKNFDNKLQYFGKGKFDSVKDQEGLSKVIINQMIQKLNDRLKNKKEKEKNERKRLKEEQLMANLNLLNKKNQSPPPKFEKLLTDINVTKKEFKTIDRDNDIDNNKINNIKSEMEKTVSTMSKLTYNDLGTEPINNSKILHWNNIKIGNRIDFFKTIMFNDENAKKKVLPQINLHENTTKPFKQHKTTTNIFDKASFYEQMNKEDYLINKKSSIIRLKKRNKKKEEVKVILEQILDLTNYISAYQTKNDMKLLEKEKWGELMKMFLREEKFHKEKKDLKHFLETQKIKETKKNKEALIREKKCEEELYDYVNYIGIFNDLIIPNENDIKNNHNNNKNKIYKEFAFVEIYSDFYDPKKNGGIDINEYEPSQDEIDNLIIPQYPDYESNKKLNFIIQHIIETEMEFSNKDDSPNKKNYNNLLSMIIDDKNNIIEKGKYFYLPIKICFTGYPLSGKKVQSNLIQEKYPNIKVYNPEQILNDKISEYNSINTPIENDPHFKKLKHNQIEELKKQKEEKLKEFEPILNIISPILNNKDENKNEANENKNEQNDSDVKSDIYMKLLINELERDFPDDKEQKVQMINEFKEKYNEYNDISKNINEINEKINEEEEKMKEANANSKDKKPKKNNNIANQHKELAQLNKDLDAIKSSLFKGFIIINFPSNEKEAKLLENYFTGYVSEYEKEIDPIELKMKKYDFIVDYNYKKEKSKETQFSFFDYIINFEIPSNEIDKRYSGIKYDPVTHKVYHIEDNPPPANDKKVMQRLIDGLPGKNKDDINNEKEKYDLENRGLFNFYKNMSNGINNVYLNIDTMNKNISDTNENILSYLENIMFNYYFMNIEVILNKINSENIQSPPKEKEKEKEKENDKNKEDSSVRITNELELSNVNSANKESSDTFLKDSSKNKVLIDYLYNKFTTFADKYKTYIKLFIQFIIEQKEDTFNYLNKKQVSFIEYLNRKTNNTEIADLYIKKYNSLFIKHPDLRQNEIVYNELMNDITDVKNSIWVSMQTKKKENVKYLQDIKNENVMQQEADSFWQFLTNIIEIEINRYLTFCEIILKYYLSKIGIVYEILDKNNNIDTAFSFDFQKILHAEVEVSNDDDAYDIKKNKKRESQKSIKQNFEIILKNTIKIIVKEDEIIKKYQDIITNLIKHSSSEQNLSQTKKAKSTFKKKLAGISYSEVSGFNEEINEIINKEKNKLKYRVLFLKYFSIKYHDTINNCFDETFVEMDKWITFNIRVQNNILNDFINYLTRSLNKNLDSVSLSNRDFDESINLSKYKIKLSDIYNKINVNGILDIYSNSKEHKLLLFENLNYTQSFSYNLNDLLNIYNSLKESGTYPFPYIIKYNIVYELFIKKYLIQKGYNILLNNINNKEIANQNNQITNNDKNNSSNKKSNKRKHSRTHQSNSKINSSSNKVNASISKANNISTTRGSEIFNHENYLKGISKKLLGLSNAKYQKLLSIFELYDNKYININELFTTLFIIGSELITPNQFFESIQGSLPENKINEKRILLTKEEFMNIKFWFENDEYLNNPCDDREFEIYKNFENEVEDKNNNGKEYKIKKIKESIFEINAEENLFDIEIFKTILDKLNKCVITFQKLRKKEESFISTSKVSISLDKNNKSSMDQNMRKSVSDSAKQTENEMKSEEKNKNSYLITKNKLNPEIENNIFDSLFLN